MTGRVGLSGGSAFTIFDRDPTSGDIAINLTNGIRNVINARIDAAMASAQQDFET